MTFVKIRVWVALIAPIKFIIIGIANGNQFSIRLEYCNLIYCRVCVCVCDAEMSFIAIIVLPRYGSPNSQRWKLVLGRKQAQAFTN